MEQSIQFRIISFSNDIVRSDMEKWPNAPVHGFLSFRSGFCFLLSSSLTLKKYRVCNVNRNNCNLWTDLMKFITNLSLWCLMFGFRLCLCTIDVVLFWQCVVNKKIEIQGEIRKPAKEISRHLSMNRFPLCDWHMIHRNQVISNKIRISNRKTWKLIT